MPIETKNERSDEATDVWETLLTRRLTDDLDAFLKEASDETFFFDDETFAPRREKSEAKRRRFKTLATIAASLAFLVAVAATARVYLAPSTSEQIVETRPANGEPSLVAWSVESLSEATWARQLETKMATADVLGLYVSTDAKGKTAEEARFAVEKNAGAEENEAPETDSDEWFNAERFADVAQLGLLKYEPFLQTVAASLR